MNLYDMDQKYADVMDLLATKAYLESFAKPAEIAAAMPSGVGYSGHCAGPLRTFKPQGARIENRAAHQ